MNPFNLRGPQFLLFYLAFGAAVLVGAALLRRRRESGPPPRLDLADPYLIATLRGGPSEAIRVALVGLIDRKLLSVDQEKLWRTTDESAVATAAHPLEAALLDRFARGGAAPESIAADGQIKAACDALTAELERHGLVAGKEIRAARAGRAGLTALVIATPGLLKLVIAYGRGHHNVGYLVLLIVALVIAALKLRGGRVTTRGRRVLADLRSLFSDLRQRASSIQPGGASSELPILAGVFGLAAVPLVLIPQVPQLTSADAMGARQDASLSTSSCGASSWGGSSSCGSSSSCSSSSSCGGGGGCGGGCGGCGS